MLQYDDDFIEQTRLSLAIKDFRNRDEYYIREEFLMPTFKVAGYDAFGTNYIARGVNLSKSLYSNNEGKRKFIYPDFVLYKNNIPVWVIDAKNSKSTIHKSTNFDQIISYSVKLNCKNCILSNARESIVLSIRDGKIIDSEIFVLEDILQAELWRKFIHVLRPESVFKKSHDFDNTLTFYNTDSYIDRSFIMDVLKSYDFGTIERYLLDSKNYQSSSIKLQALPAILIAPQAQRNPPLFNKILQDSFNNGNAIVRENCLTTLISIKDDTLSKTFKIIDNAISSHSPKTFLEEFLLISLFSKTRKGRSILRKYNPKKIFLKKYIENLYNLKPVSFPLALLIKKPSNISYRDYYYNISLLPAIIEHTFKDPECQYETLIVISNCLKFAKASNYGVFRKMVTTSTKDQNKIIGYLSNNDF